MDGSSFFGVDAIVWVVLKGTKSKPTMSGVAHGCSILRPTHTTKGCKLVNFRKDANGIAHKRDSQEPQLRQRCLQWPT